jgi:aryl-alcohol dehydrogenase-like predicted oxidoreductase
MEQLRRLAADRGVSPTALAIDWVLERLDEEDTETGPLPVAVEVETPAWRSALRRLGRQ